MAHRTQEDSFLTITGLLFRDKIQYQPDRREAEKRLECERPHPMRHMPHPALLLVTSHLWNPSARVSMQVSLCRPGWLIYWPLVMNSTPFPLENKEEWYKDTVPALSAKLVHLATSPYPWWLSKASY